MRMEERDSIEGEGEEREERRGFDSTRCQLLFSLCIFFMIII